uniref:Uncharacterized protein n=1 Tax=viral metagenome TaxID=1070528 RepID=A0A6C0I7F1_9ZZZZ
MTTKYQPPIELTQEQWKEGLNNALTKATPAAVAAFEARKKKAEADKLALANYAEESKNKLLIGKPPGPPPILTAAPSAPPASTELKWAPAKPPRTQTSKITPTPNPNQTNPFADDYDFKPNGGRKSRRGRRVRKSRKSRRVKKSKKSRKSRR